MPKKIVCAHCGCEIQQGESVYLMAVEGSTVPAVWYHKECFDTEGELSTDEAHP